MSTPFPLHPMASDLWSENDTENGMKGIGPSPRLTWKLSIDLGGGFKQFLNLPLPGEDFQFD